MSAQDLMTPNPVTVTPDVSLAEVWNLMRDRGIRHVPVVDEGTLVGLLSDRDLAHFDMTRQGEVVDLLIEHRVGAVPVVRPETATPSDELASIIQMMTERRIRHVPITDGDELIGIVSIGDVLRFQRDQYRGEAATLEARVLSP